MIFLTEKLNFSNLGMKNIILYFVPLLFLFTISCPGNIYYSNASRAPVYDDSFKEVKSHLGKGEPFQSVSKEIHDSSVWHTIRNQRITGYLREEYISPNPFPSTFFKVKSKERSDLHSSPDLNSQVLVSLKAGDEFMSDYCTYDYFDSEWCYGNYDRFAGYLRREALEKLESGIPE